MENRTTSIESLFERVKNYIETRIELLKLKAIDKSSSFVSVLATYAIVFTFFWCFFLLLNIGIALLIGELIGTLYYGFFILAAFYAIVGFVLLKYKNKWLKKPMINMMVKGLHED
ncbi:MAG: phage holin family protein [Ginsengibacter sp.]